MGRAEESRLQEVHLCLVLDKEESGVSDFWSQIMSLSSLLEVQGCKMSTRKPRKYSLVKTTHPSEHNIPSQFGSLLSRRTLSEVSREKCEDPAFRSWLCHFLVR